MQLNPLIVYHKAFQNPKTRLMVVVLTSIYLISPIDLIPEFLPVIGLLDDGILLVMFMVEVVWWLVSRNRSLPSKNKRGEVVDADFKPKNNNHDE